MAQTYFLALIGLNFISEASQIDVAAVAERGAFGQRSEAAQIDVAAVAERGAFGQRSEAAQIDVAAVAERGAFGQRSEACQIDVAVGHFHPPICERESATDCR